MHQPEKALELPVATQILFEGMMRADSRIGDFTGLALDDCFNATHDDWIRARAIVNGTDHAAAIADIGRTFYAAILQAEIGNKTEDGARNAADSCSPTGAGCWRSSAVVSALAWGGLEHARRVSLSAMGRRTSSPSSGPSSKRRMRLKRCPTNC